MNILNENENDNKNWTSKTELMIDLDISSDTIDQITYEYIILWMAQILKGIKKGGCNNLETYYNYFLATVIKEKAKHYTNQNTNATKKTKEQGILLKTVINSGDLKAARYLCDLIMEKTETQAAFKKMSEQTKTQAEKMSEKTKTQAEKMSEQTKQIEKEIKYLTDLLYNCKS